MFSNRSLQKYFILGLNWTASIWHSYLTDTAAEHFGFELLLIEQDNSGEERDNRDVVAQNNHGTEDTKGSDCGKTW